MPQGLRNLGGGSKPPGLAWSVVALPVESILALFFDLKRMRDIGETIKRRLK